jgi:hypothetical protein
VVARTIVDPALVPGLDWGLSQIARLITGTRWNGPAFFGLRQNNGKASAGSADAS